MYTHMYGFVLVAYTTNSSPGRPSSDVLHCSTLQTGTVQEPWRWYDFLWEEMLPRSFELQFHGSLAIPLRSPHLKSHPAAVCAIGQPQQLSQRRLGRNRR